MYGSKVSVGVPTPLTGDMFMLVPDTLMCTVQVLAGCSHADRLNIWLHTYPINSVDLQDANRHPSIQCKLI